MLFGVLSALLCRISSADISHILGNLEEISIFQQMLVQSLEEHTKLVFICLQNAVHLCNCLALEFRYTKLKKKKGYRLRIVQSKWSRAVKQTLMLGWLLLGKATEAPSGWLQEQLIWPVVRKSNVSQPKDRISQYFLYLLDCLTAVQLSVVKENHLVQVWGLLWWCE